MATGPIETHLHRSFNWENAVSGALMGPRGRSANCGNGLFAQCVRLRSEINRFIHFDLPNRDRFILVGFIRQNGKGGRPRVVMRPAPFGVLYVYGGARFIEMPQLGRFRR